MTRCTDTCCRPEYDGPVVVMLGERRFRARSSYTCRDCGLLIEPGTPYTRRVMLVDDEFHTTRTHDPYGFCVDQLL